jgi:hypothetical protein
MQKNKGGKDEEVFIDNAVGSCAAEPDFDGLWSGGA